MNIVAEICLPAGTKTISVSEIPRLIAEALSPIQKPNSFLEKIAQEEVRFTHHENIARFALTGAFVSRDPITMTQQIVLVGDTLQQSVLLVSEFSEYVARFGLGVKVLTEEQIVASTPKDQKLQILSKDSFCSEESENPVKEPPELSYSMKRDKLKKQDRQEYAILEWFKNHNCDPLEVPIYKLGKESNKGNVRSDMLKMHHLFSKKSFDKAWERLRKDKRIQDK